MMKPYRKEKKKRFAQDPWNENVHELGEEETTHVLSDQGALESLEVENPPVSFCGCISPPVGFCAVCLSKGMKGTICSACRTFCSSCHKQICPRHTVFRDLSNDDRLHLCEECHVVVGRNRISKTLTRMFFSPFIRFEDENE